MPRDTDEIDLGMRGPGIRTPRPPSRPPVRAPSAGATSQIDQDRARRASRARFSEGIRQADASTHTRSQLDDYSPTEQKYIISEYSRRRNEDPDAKGTDLVDQIRYDMVIDKEIKPFLAGIEQLYRHKAITNKYTFDDEESLKALEAKGVKPDVYLRGYSDQIGGGTLVLNFDSAEDLNRPGSTWEEYEQNLIRKMKDGRIDPTNVLETLTTDLGLMEFQTEPNGEVKRDPITGRRLVKPTGKVAEQLFEKPGELPSLAAVSEGIVGNAKSREDLDFLMASVVATIATAGIASIGAGLIRAGGMAVRAGAQTAAVGVVTTQDVKGPVDDWARTGLGVARSVENATFGAGVRKVSNALGLPEPVGQVGSQILLPSTVLMATKHPLARGKTFSSLSRGRQMAILGIEGANYGMLDIGAYAWSEGRNPTASEIQLGFMLGGGADIALGTAIPALGRVLKSRVVMDAVGHLGLPDVTARMLNRMPGGVQRAWKSIFKIDAAEFDDAATVQRMAMASATDPRVAGETLENIEARLVSGQRPRTGEPEVGSRQLSAQTRSVGESEVVLPQGSVVLHGTASSNVVDITHTGLRPGEANQFGRRRVYVTTDYDTATGFAQRAAAVNNQSLGDVMSFSAGRDLRLLKEGSPEYTEIANKALKDIAGTSGREPDRLIQDEVARRGYDGIYKPAVMKDGNILKADNAIIFSEEGASAMDSLVVGPRVIKHDTMMNQQLAEHLSTRRKAVTPSQVMTGWNPEEVLQFAEALAGKGFNEKGRVTLKRILSDLRAENPEAAAKAEAILASDAEETGVDFLVDSLDDVNPPPKLRSLLEHIYQGNELDRIMSYIALIKQTSRPAPRGFWGRHFNQAKAILTWSPAHIRRTQGALEAASMLYEYDGVRVGTRFLAITKTIDWAFGGKGIFKNQKDTVKELGLKYEGPALPPGSEDVVDTAFFIFENVEHYTGPPEVLDRIRRAAGITEGIFNKDLDYSARLGLDIDPITSMVYMPHGLDLDAGSQGAIRSTAASVVRMGKAGSFKKRRYGGMAEFASVMHKHGIPVNTDPLSLTAKRLMGAASTRRNHLYLQGVAEQYGRYDPNPFARAQVGETELPLKRGGETGRWFLDDEIMPEVRHLTQGGKLEELPTYQAAEMLVDEFRGLMLSVDLSAFTIQGWRLFASDPASFLRNAGQHAMASTNRENFIHFMAAHQDAFALFSAAGGSVYSSALDLPQQMAALPGTTVGLRGGKLKQKAQRAVMLGPVGEAMWMRFLPVAKITAFQSYIDLLRGLRDGNRVQRTLASVPGVSPKVARQMAEPLDSLLEGIPVISAALKKFGGVKDMDDWTMIRAAADAATNTGGGINWTLVGNQPGLLQRFLFLTPGWMRANVGSVLNASKVGSPKGVLARRIFFQQMALTAAVATTASVMWSGKLPSYDPRKGDWLNVQTPEGSVSILPSKTYVRVLSRLAGGTPWEDDEVEGRVRESYRFLEGRQGMFPAIVQDLITGEDYFGNKIENPYAYLGTSVLPLGVGETVTALQEGVKGEELATRVGSAFLGMNFIPTNTFDRIDNEVARAPEWRQSGEPFRDTQGNILTEWNELTEDQKTEFRAFDDGKEGGHLIDRLDREQARKESPYPELEAVEQAAEFALSEAGKSLQQEGATPGSRENYRRRVSAIRTAERIGREILRQQADLQDQEPNSVDQRILEGYFEEVVDSSLDPELRRRVKGQMDKGSIEDTIMTLALEIDPEIFEQNEREYFGYVKSKYGAESLKKLKTLLRLDAMKDPVLASYTRDRDMLDAGYFQMRSDLFTPEVMKRVGLPAELPDFYHTWEEFKQEELVHLFDQLSGRILPTNIGNLKTDRGRDAPTVYERFGIHPTEPLNQAQAEGVSRVVGGLVFKDYEEILNEASTIYLSQHQQQLCSLWYWEYRVDFNDDLKQYLGTCGNRAPQPANYP